LLRASNMPTDKAGITIAEVKAVVRVWVKKVDNPPE
jgi:hypothetical protein